MTHIFCVSWNFERNLFRWVLGVVKTRFLAWKYLEWHNKIYPGPSVTTLFLQTNKNMTHNFCGSWKFERNLFRWVLGVANTLLLVRKYLEWHNNIYPGSNATTLISHTNKNMTHNFCGSWNFERNLFRWVLGVVKTRFLVRKYLEWHNKIYPGPNATTLILQTNKNMTHNFSGSWNFDRNLLHWVLGVVKTRFLARKYL